MASPEALVCRPNISAAGRRRRRRFGSVMAATAIGVAGWMAITHAYWPWRAVVFFPVALAAIGFLQVSRNTCIARAGEGTFENDDFSTTPAPEAEVTASRAVAKTIRRDAVIIGLAGAAVALATALVS